MLFLVYMLVVGWVALYCVGYTCLWSNTLVDAVLPIAAVALLASRSVYQLLPPSKMLQPIAELAAFRAHLSPNPSSSALGPDVVHRCFVMPHTEGLWSGPELAILSVAAGD